MNAADGATVGESDPVVREALAQSAKKAVQVALLRAEAVRPQSGGTDGGGGVATGTAREWRAAGTARERRAAAQRAERLRAEPSLWLSGRGAVIRQDLRHLLPISVDNAEALEVDDAVSGNTPLPPYLSPPSPPPSAPTPAPPPTYPKAPSYSLLPPATSSYLLPPPPLLPPFSPPPSVERDTRGKLTLWVHIADTDAALQRLPPLVSATLQASAHRRATSCYLPSGCWPMFPYELAARDFALRDAHATIHGQPNEALSIRIRLSETGELLEHELIPSIISPTVRLTYDAAAEVLAGRADAGQAATEALRTLSEVAQRRIVYRSARGACVVSMPSPEVVLWRARPRRRLGGRLGGRPGEAELAGALQVRASEGEAAKILVSEMMILAGEAAAQHALVRELPFVYRTQQLRRATPSLGGGANGDGVDSGGANDGGAHGGVEAFGGGLDPPLLDEDDEVDACGYVGMWRALSALESASLSSTPKRHEALGLDTYAQITSPVRRYADLLQLQQLKADLLGERLPCEDADQMREMLVESLRRTRSIAALQRASHGFWALRYLREAMLLAGPRASVLAHPLAAAEDGAVLAVLPELGSVQRITLAQGAKVHVGLTQRLQLLEVSPHLNRLSLGPLGNARAAEQALQRHLAQATAWRPSSPRAARAGGAQAQAGARYK